MPGGSQRTHRRETPTPSRRFRIFYDPPWLSPRDKTPMNFPTPSIPTPSSQSNGSNHSFQLNAGTYGAIMPATFDNQNLDLNPKSFSPLVRGFLDYLKLE